MLHLSDKAAVLIRHLVADADLPDTAGLRVGTDPDNHCLSLSLAQAPDEQDVVVARDGASLFLTPDALPRVNDQTLHAQLAERPAFFMD